MVVIASSLHALITYSLDREDDLSTHLARNASLKASLSNLVSSISTDKTEDLTHLQFSASNLQVQSFLLWRSAQRRSPIENDLGYLV